MNDSLANVVRSSAVWLEQQITQEGGWSERKGTQPNSMNTAEALLALMDSGLASGTKQVQEGVAYLVKHQLSVGTDTGAWPREAGLGTSAKTPDLVRTSIVLRALIRAGEHQHVPSGLAWLLGASNPEKLWGFAKGGKTEIVATGLVCLTLIEAALANRSEVEGHLGIAINHLNNWLSAKAYENEAVAAVSVVYAATALQMLRLKRGQISDEAEKAAITWLLENQDVALRRVEQVIQLDPTGAHDYVYTHMMDAMILSLLVFANDRKYAKSRLATRVLIRLKDNSAPGGAFYGVRTFTWSTAHAISALAKASQFVQAFPTRPSEPKQRRVRYLLLAVAIAVLVAALALAAFDKLTTPILGFLEFMILICLLLTGNIREETLVKLVPGGSAKSKEGD